MQRLSRTRFRRSGRDDGVAAIIVAIALVPVLFGAAAIGIDLSRLNVAAQDLQRTADAAALAGVVHLPGNEAEAIAQATRIARANSGNEATADSTIAVAVPPGRPTQLQVTMSAVVHNVFAGLLGVPDNTVSRTATADYTAPLVLGSPCNVFGREDMPAFGGGAEQAPVGGTACAGAGRFWTGIFGPSLDKGFGDAYASNWCVWPSFGKATAQCAPTGAGPTPPGANLQFRPDGYTYVVRVTKPGRLRVQGYDLAWAPAGPRCIGILDESAPTGLAVPLAGAESVLANEFVNVTPELVNTRYAPLPTEYCAGDTQQPYPYADANPDALQMRTTFEVRAPDISVTEPGELLCPATVAPGFNGLTTSFAQLLAPGTGGAEGLELRRQFHRWADLCPGTVVNPGDYVVRVTTSEGSGANRFALRAWLTDETGTMLDGAVSVVARERMGVYTNFTAGESTFHLVRLDSSTAGGTLEVGVFDIGDAAVPVDVTLLSPDSDTPLGPCAISGAITEDSATCNVKAESAVTNGQWVYFAVPIPPDYRCPSDADQSRCWVRVRVTAASEVFDATTWIAKMAGDPVRLIK